MTGKSFQAAWPWAGGREQGVCWRTERPGLAQDGRWRGRRRAQALGEKERGDHGGKARPQALLQGVGCNPPETDQTDRWASEGAADGLQALLCSPTAGPRRTREFSSGQGRLHSPAPTVRSEFAKDCLMPQHSSPSMFPHGPQRPQGPESPFQRQSPGFRLPVPGSSWSWARGDRYAEGRPVGRTSIWTI